jgi:hypothetical protein
MRSVEAVRAGSETVVASWKVSAPSRKAETVKGEAEGE